MCLCVHAALIGFCGVHASLKCKTNKVALLSNWEPFDLGEAEAKQHHEIEFPSPGETMRLYLGMSWI